MSRIYLFVIISGILALVAYVWIEAIVIKQPAYSITGLTQTVNAQVQSQSPLTISWQCGQHSFKIWSANFSMDFINFSSLNGDRETSLSCPKRQQAAYHRRSSLYFWMGHLRIPLPQKHQSQRQ